MRSKTETRRQAIIEVAGAVFDEHGFNGASMSEIAARLGGSKATLYSYFSSKEELFMAVVLGFSEAHFLEVFGALTACEDLEAGLREFGGHFLGTIFRADMVRGYRNICGEAGKSSVSSLYYRSGPFRGASDVAQFMQSAMEQGRLRPAPPLVAAHHFLALLKAEGFEALMLGACDAWTTQEITEMVERAVTVFIRAYAPES